MVRAMPPVRNLPPGYTIIYPNRDKASSKITRLIVTLILILSAVLILVVTAAAWSKLQGLKPVSLLWCVLYIIMAVFVLRWSRGVLPMAATLAILMLLIAVIAGTGASGTSWFQRNTVGYAAPHSLFGGKGFGPDTLGLLTLLIAPVQLLLIMFAMLGFSQGWNVELEAPEDPAQRRGQQRSQGRGGQGAAPAAA